MSAKDVYHQIVKEALIREGWIITADPLQIKWADQTMEIDLGAEQLIAAENNQRKIAIEIKSFLNLSPISDFYNAVGQYMVYERALKKIEPDRMIYLAIPRAAYTRLFQQRPIGLLFTEDRSLSVLVFNPQAEESLQWIPNPLIAPS